MKPFAHLVKRGVDRHAVSLMPSVDIMDVSRVLSLIIVRASKCSSDTG